MANGKNKIRCFRLTDRLMRSLRRIARQERRTMAEVVRLSLERTAARGRSPQKI
jgi:hypothetical protein